MLVISLYCEMFQLPSIDIYSTRDRQLIVSSKRCQGDVHQTQDLSFEPVSPLPLSHQAFPVKTLSSQLTHWELTLKLMVGSF